MAQQSQIEEREPGLFVVRHTPEQRRELYTLTNDEIRRMLSRRRKRKSTKSLVVATKRDR